MRFVSSNARKACIFRDSSYNPSATLHRIYGFFPEILDHERVMTELYDPR